MPDNDEATVLHVFSVIVCFDGRFVVTHVQADQPVPLSMIERFSDEEELITNVLSDEGISIFRPEPPQLPNRFMFHVSGWVEIYDGQIEFMFEINDVKVLI